MSWESLAFVGSNGVTHSKLSVAVWVLGLDQSIGKASRSVTQPPGVAASHG